MEFFKQIMLHESRKASQKEIDHTITVVNKIYNEWKKIGRRINAVDLITTSVNKISLIDPTVIPLVHEATRLKIATIIVRCMDLAVWKDPHSKEKIYKKLWPLIEVLQTYDPNTGSNGNVREVIMTRLSAALTHHEKASVFVAYEPTISNSYLKYLFKDEELPKKTVKMKALGLPADFGSLMNILSINLNKVATKPKEKKKAE